jgi:hypothetical protein
MLRTMQNAALFESGADIAKPPCQPFYFDKDEWVSHYEDVRQAAREAAGDEAL